MLNGMKKVILMACAVAMLATVQAKPADHAKLSIHKNNIKVWTIQNSQNPVFLYKAETTYDTALEKAVSLILDVDHAVQWVPYMGSIKVLSRDDKKGEFLLYMVLDFPFPLKDRDLVVQGKMIKDAQGIITIKNKAVDKGYAKNENRTWQAIRYSTLARSFALIHNIKKSPHDADFFNGHILRYILR